MREPTPTPRQEQRHTPARQQTPAHGPAPAQKHPSTPPACPASPPPSPNANTSTVRPPRRGLPHRLRTNDGNTHYTLTAQWPRAHTFFTTPDGTHHHPLQAAETIRQTGIYLAHAELGILSAIPLSSSCA
ncbi:AfsA-related hotdog domain-containing protein [Streptomyces sp. RLB1-9]|uniref:AfsA-related hotdog domain-containing protein n=1 Tax=Streptomyces sp. RLB1-9 TaxID=2594454 RepID=UPI001F087068|nr:AfsA-related hotdog domain-containing protein [Streptomyces sp. RLB1-9]